MAGIGLCIDFVVHEPGEIVNAGVGYGNKTHYGVNPIHGAKLAVP
jgi:hypothetical protein